MSARLGSEYAFFVTAEKKNDPVYQKLVAEEKFDCKVLIATSVINNGVNIKDPMLKNIYVQHFDKTECIQMVGRVRMNHTGSKRKINLYLPAYRVSDLERMKTNFADILTKLLEFDELDERARIHFFNDLHKTGDFHAKYFYLNSNSKPDYNFLLKAVLKQKIDYLDMLIARVENDDSTLNTFTFNDFIFSKRKLELQKLACEKGQEVIGFFEGQAFVDICITSAIEVHNDLEQQFINKDTGEYVIMSEYLSWFGRMQDPEPLLTGHEIREDNKTALRKLLESNSQTVDDADKEAFRQAYIDHGFNKQAQKVFREQITELIQVAYSGVDKARGEDGTYDKNFLNSFFADKEIPYTICSEQIHYRKEERDSNPQRPKTETLWLIVRK